MLHECNILLSYSWLSVSTAPVLSRQTLIWLNVLLPFATGCIDCLSPSFLPVTDCRLPNYFKEQKGWASRGDRECFNLRLEVENTNSFGTGLSLKSVTTQREVPSSVAIMQQQCSPTVMQTGRTRKAWPPRVNGQTIIDLWVKYKLIQLTLKLKILQPSLGEDSFMKLFFQCSKFNQLERAPCY